MSDKNDIRLKSQTRLTEAEVAQLEEAAYMIRVLATRVISMCCWGHIGGSYSLAEILVVLYGKAANISPQTCQSEQRDFIVLSKAHASPALYSALYQFGYMDEKKLFSYGTVEGLEGHLRIDESAGVECTGGSLGLGLSYCVGLALAYKMKQAYSPRVYCICGDGELNEGQMWEAIMSAAHYRLDNLVLLIDNNKVMAKSFTHEGMNVAPLREKFISFGWHVLACDGHNVCQIWQKIHQAKYGFDAGKPTAIVLDTVKGMGVPECEFNYRWHTHAPDIDTANRFLAELSKTYNRPKSVIEALVKDVDTGLQGILEEDS